MAYTVVPDTHVYQLINAAWLTTYVKDNLTALNAAGGLIPTGVIMLWGDSIANIPTGWHHNDNSGGAIIDLRDKFVIGAGSTYAVAASGGAVSVSLAAHSAHNVTQPSHSAHSVTQPADTHTQEYGFQMLGGNSYIGDPIGSMAHSGMAVSNTHAHASAALSGAHTHSTISVLPPYTSLAYMQKIAPSGSFVAANSWVNGNIPTAAQLNQDLRDNPLYLLSRICTQKTIALWSGSIASIPSGWVHCNGANSTYDLRDKFIPGAGNLYAVGAVGGQLIQNLGAHGSHTVTQPGAHSDHVLTQATAHTTGGMAGGVSAVSPILSANNHSGATIDAHSAHSSWGVDAHALHADITTLPPYKALAYMMLSAVGSSTTPKTWTTGEIVQNSEFATYIRDNFAAIVNGTFPIGGIGIWSASIATIPANWQICNGTNGTPDLRDFIPVGAGTSYAVNATGGVISNTPAAHSAHTVTQPSNHSAHSVAQLAAHGWANVSVSGATGSPKLSSVISATDTHSGWGVDAHSAHAFTVDAHSAHAAISLLPTYVAYAYIQRLT